MGACLLTAGDAPPLERRAVDALDLEALPARTHGRGVGPTARARPPCNAQRRCCLSAVRRRALQCQLRKVTALLPWLKLQAACSRGAAAAEQRAASARARRWREAGARPQPCTGPATEKELPDDSAATDQYGHTPLFSIPYPHEPCRPRPRRAHLLGLRGACPCRQACGRVLRSAPRSRLGSCIKRHPLCWCPDSATSSHCPGRVGRLCGGRSGPRCPGAVRGSAP